MVSPLDPYAIKPDSLKEAQAILSGVDPSRALEAVVAWLLEDGVPADRLRAMLARSGR